MIVEGSLERFEVPPEMVLTVRPMASSGEAWAVSIYGAAFDAAHATFAAPVSLVPFTETCTIGVTSAGGPTYVETGPPRNTFTAAQEENRLAANAIGAAMATDFGLPFVDIATVTGGVSDGTRILWPAGYSSDGLHPNDTALAAWAREFANELLALA